MSTLRRLRLLYCHDCRGDRDAEREVLPGRLPGHQLWHCDDCGAVILCDYCGRPWSEDHPEGQCGEEADR